MDISNVYELSQKCSVLYVEDDLSLLEESQIFLQELFGEVMTATNGEEGLQIYRTYRERHGAPVDLVITDINMPVMDGMEMIREIHEIEPEQSIIVISAYNESSRLVDLIQCGISTFVMKPIDYDVFLNVLYKTLKSIVNQKDLLRYQRQLEELNASLDAKVVALSEEVVAVQHLAVETLAKMIESYDDETGTHVKRIQAYTEALIEGLNEKERYLSQELQQHIPFASILHDIGKLFIPKEILIKPDKLDEEEFNIVKEHARLGGEVFEIANETFKKRFGKDSYLKIAANIAMYHHERYDGKGYPKGLVGEEIPLEARIVSIADVYDALRSKRVYKPPFSHEKAVAIIESEKAKAFDPVLVDIFLKKSDRFNDIYERLSKG